MSTPGEYIVTVCWNQPLLTFVSSIWIEQIQSTFAVGHAQAGKYPELRTLFYRLARLSSSRVQPVFVLDGRDRPRVKRNKNVFLTEHWMVPDVKELVESFGFDWHQVGIFLRMSDGIELTFFARHLERPKPSWHG